MKFYDVVICEREDEFALCLSEGLQSFGLRVRSTSSLEELPLLMQGKGAPHLIWDLGADAETRRLLERPVFHQNDGTRVVFTSIFNDPGLWPELAVYSENSLFLAKPFRLKSLLTFLYPEKGTESVRYRYCP